MTFAEWVARVLEHEGGLVDDPDDPGGLTNMGIAFHVYGDELGADGIRNLTRAQAEDIYRRDYWNAVKADDMPDAVRGTVADMGVNAGPGMAVKLLQSSCNAFLQSQIAVDGGVGPLTLAAVGSVDATALLQHYTAQRVAHYTNVATKNTALKKYMRGWLRRAYSWMD